MFPLNAKSIASCQVLARAVSGIVGFAGLAVVAGWIFDRPLLRSAVRGWAEMKPNAAVALLLAAGALWLHGPEESLTSPWRRRFALLAAGGVVLIGALALAGPVFGPSQGGDAWFIRTAGETIVPWLGRMPPWMALDFLLLGTALLLFGVKPTPAAIWTAQVCLLLAACGAFVAVVGCLYGRAVLGLAPLFAGTTLPAAVALLALSAGVACARPADGMMALFNAASAGGSVLRRLLPPVALLPVAIDWLELEGERRGLFPAGFGRVLDAAVTVVLLGLVVWTVSRLVHKRDEARQAAEEELGRSEERYRQLVEMSPVAILVKDGRRIEFANAAACRLVGAERGEEIVGKPSSAFMPPESRAAFEREFSGVLREGTPLPRMDQKLVRLDGQEVDVELSVAPVSYHGRQFAQVIARDVTAARRADEQLRFQASLLDQVRNAVVAIDAEGRINYWNRHATTLYQWTAEEVLGRNLQELLIPAPEQARAAAIVEAMQATGSWEGEFSARSKDGRIFPVYVVDTLLRDRQGRIHGIVGVSVDITAEKQAAAILQASEERFRVTFEQASVGMGIAALEGRVLRVNRKFCSITGYTADELLARTFQSITHPDDLELGARQVRRLVSGEIATYTQEKRYVRKDGTFAWVNMTASLVRRNDGSPDSFIAIIDDITARRNLEAQLRHTQKMEAIGQLAGGVAHDFNNILTAIQGHVTLMGMGDTLSASARESLEEIAASARRAASLTRQLLLFSRREIMQLNRLNLNDAIAQMAKMLQRLIGENVLLKLHLHHQPLPIFADAGMIDQILMNLAVNARDAMPGGGDLVVETSEQLVDAAMAGLIEAEPGHYGCLSVSDTGSGIAPDVLPRIFEPFFTTKAAGKGTGLGLATVFGIVKQHRGWMKVYSEPGHGTTFRVFLPLTSAPAAIPLPPRNPAFFRGSGEAVLFVEDDEAVRAMSSAVLARHGYNVISAYDGNDALQRWTEAGGRIDLLLTDLVMPGGMGGTELAARLRALQPDLKVIFTSGYSPEIAGRSLGLRAGQAFLQKPFEVVDLLTRIDALLAAKRGQSSSH
jgi:PAS domain S-box-containing protein